MSENPGPEEPKTGGAPVERGETAPIKAEGWLPAPAVELFGEGAGAVDAYELLTVDVPAEKWLSALLVARDTLGCGYFDWLSAVDEPGTGFLVCAHLVALPAPAGGRAAASGTPGDGSRALRRLVLRTAVPHVTAELPTATEVYAGAAWHERETYEMFGVRFDGHPGLEPLLLPDGFEGHPLRKDFVLAARVAKAWPGAKEPGESHDGGPKRRQMLPPGVPDPNEWGPLKGQLPPTPARGRASAGRTGAGRAGAGRAAATDRPRRNRSASQGSASQQPGDAAPSASGERPSETQAPESAPPEASMRPTRPRRNRSASGGSASQRATPPDRSSSEPHTPGRRDQDDRPEPRQQPGQRSSDAPWHHARPAHEEAVDERDVPKRGPERSEPATAPSPADPERHRRTEDEG